MGWEDPLEKEITVHSSILVWKTTSTEESGRLRSMGHKELDTAEHTGTHTQWILSVMRFS